MEYWRTLRPVSEAVHSARTQALTFAGDAVDVLGDAVAVIGAASEGFQDQHIERAGQEIGSAFSHCLSIPRMSMP
jgi:hypothetical protein